jgi:hypothetical protein
MRLQNGEMVKGHLVAGRINLTAPDGSIRTAMVEPYNPSSVIARGRIVPRSFAAMFDIPPDQARMAGNEIHVYFRDAFGKRYEVKRAVTADETVL